MTSSLNGIISISSQEQVQARQTGQPIKSMHLLGVQFVLVYPGEHNHCHSILATHDSELKSLSFMS
jgi:hypothetical protein